MTEPSTDDAPPDDLAALIRRQDAALQRHRAGDTAEQIADRLAAYGYAGIPPGYARAAVKADLAAAVAREDGRGSNHTALIRQVVEAKFGDHLMIRVPSDVGEDQARALLATLRQINPGTKMTVLACDASVLADTQLIDQAVSAMTPAYDSLAGTGADRDAMVAAVKAMLTWLTTEHPADA